MNDDELAALWEKLVAKGLPEAEADEHVRRAMLGEGPEEQATTPLEAGAMHAVEGLSMGLAGRPGPGSGYQGSEGGRQMLDPESRAKREAFADDKDLALAIAEAEHPVASTTGKWGTLALPGVGMGPRGIMATGRAMVNAPRALAAGGGRLLRAAKNYATSPHTMVGRIGNAWQKAAPKAVKAADEVIPQVEGLQSIGESVGRLDVPPPPRSQLAAAKTQLAGDLPARRAALRVDEDIAAGARGPRGGGLISSKDAAGRVRVSSPKPNAAVPDNLKQMVDQARGIGMDEETIARRLFEEGLQPEQVERALSQQAGSSAGRSLP